MKGLKLFKRKPKPASHLFQLENMVAISDDEARSRRSSRASNSRFGDESSMASSLMTNDESSMMMDDSASQMSYSVNGDGKAVLRPSKTKKKLKEKKLKKKKTGTKLTKKKAAANKAGDSRVDDDASEVGTTISLAATMATKSAEEDALLSPSKRSPKRIGSKTSATPRRSKLDSDGNEVSKRKTRSGSLGRRKKEGGTAHRRKTKVGGSDDTVTKERKQKKSTGSAMEEHSRSPKRSAHQRRTVPTSVIADQDNNSVGSDMHLSIEGPLVGNNNNHAEDKDDDELPMSDNEQIVEGLEYAAPTKTPNGGDHASDENNTMNASEHRAKKKKDAQSMVTKNKALKAANDSLVAEMDKLKSEVEQSKEEAATATSALKVENESLLAQIEKLQSDLLAKAEHQDEEKKEESQEAEESAAAQLEIESLREELSQVQSELTSSQSAHQVEKEEKERLEQELEQTNASLMLATNEMNDLRVDVEEYEEAINEKEALVEKLTEALDSQLDKVDLLELKMHRAEQEFVKLEDEMKDMENEIITLRGELSDEEKSRKSPSKMERNSTSRSSDDGSIKSMEDTEPDIDPEQYQKTKKSLDQREKVLNDREADLFEREQDLDLDREARLEEWEAELMDLEERLKIEEDIMQERLSEREENDNAKEAAAANSPGDQPEPTATISDNIGPDCSPIQESREVQNGSSVHTADSISAGAKELEHELEQRNILISELQEEIADLRDKILKKENEVALCRNDVEIQLAESEEMKKEVHDLEREMGELRQEIQAEKVDTKKKMERKDEAIAFMQGEMARLGKEKQSSVEQGRLQAMKDVNHNIQKMQMQLSDSNDEMELERLHAINAQLRQLDGENKFLQQQFSDFQEVNAQQIKQKDDFVHELLDEITELKQDIEIRKEAECIKLNQEKKQVKEAHAATKKELRTANNRLVQMDTEIKDLQVEKVDMLADIEELKTSFTAKGTKKYVSSLKRQVASLKDHNKALERKLEYERSAATKNLDSKDETIQFLQKQIVSLKETREYPKSPGRGSGKKPIWSMLSPMRKNKKSGISSKANAALSDGGSSVQDMMSEIDSEYGEQS